MKVDIVRLLRPVSNLKPLDGRFIGGDLLRVLPHLPASSFDLIIADPPYNLTKTFGSRVFRERSHADYRAWIQTWLPGLRRLLKPSGSLYVCGDWRCSGLLQEVLEKHFTIQNRITWEREKGRGAKRNWKNASEDIWFCTASPDRFYFDVEAVKLRRRVLAPYRANGVPKDWEQTGGGNFRMTHPSNLWTDISVPFWSMPENTDHPTQKPEKLIAKLILASSQPGDWILDPFVGSGTTSVVAKKLGRRCVGVDLEDQYLCLALKRWAAARLGGRIQGYDGRVFWERNAQEGANADGDMETR